MHTGGWGRLWDMLLLFSGTERACCVGNLAYTFFLKCFGRRGLILGHSFITIVRRGLLASPADRSIRSFPSIMRGEVVFVRQAWSLEFG